MVWVENPTIFGNISISLRWWNQNKRVKFWRSCYDHDTAMNQKLWLWVRLGVTTSLTRATKDQSTKKLYHIPTQLHFEALFIELLSRFEAYLLPNSTQAQADLVAMFFFQLRKFFQVLLQRCDDSRGNFRVNKIRFVFPIGSLIGT